MNKSFAIASLLATVAFTSFAQTPVDPVHKAPVVASASGAQSKPAMHKKPHAATHHGKKKAGAKHDAPASSSK